MKVALKAGKACLAQEDAELCVRVMERGAVFAEQLGKAADGGVEEDYKSTAKRLQAEYFVLRTTLVGGDVSRTGDVG